MKAEKKALVVNLFGGPGTGKSTTAAGLFYLMKSADINCELITEFAKDMTWAKRQQELWIQPYIFGKQLHKQCRVLDQVDVMVTDSPIILSAIYTNRSIWPDSFIDSVVDIYNRFNNLNIFLVRTKSYNPIGRNQTEAEARLLDEEIQNFLLDKKEDCHRIVADKEAPRRIFDLVAASLNPKEKEKTG